MVIKNIDLLNLNIQLINTSNREIANPIDEQKEEKVFLLDEELNDYFTPYQTQANAVFSKILCDKKSQKNISIESIKNDRYISSIQQRNEYYFELSRKAGHSFSTNFEVNASFVNPTVVICKDLQLLGKGKSGQVFLGQDLEGRCFALKEYHSLSRVLESMDQEFDIEDEIELDIKTLAASLFDELGVSKAGIREFEKSLILNHPTIVNVHALVLKVDNGEVKTHLLMEYLQGSELKKIEDKSLSTETAKKGLDETLDALLYLIDKGLVPTDLHGDNIIITEQGFRIVDLEGHETFQEAALGNSSDSKLKDRINDTWELVTLITKKTNFPEKKIEQFKISKNCFFTITLLN
jgi:hypothetical protein